MLFAVIEHKCQFAVDYHLNNSLVALPTPAVILTSFEFSLRLLDLIILFQSGYLRVSTLSFKVVTER